MLILIECPFCESRFQVEPSLRGRQIRCPNADCRQVFEVREVAPVPEPVIEGVPLPSPPPAQKTGQVGDMVPVVTAEAAVPRPPNWRDGPPPARRADGGPTTPLPSRAPRPTSAPAPVAEEPPSRRIARSRSRGDEVKEKRPRKSERPVEPPPGEWDAPRCGTGN